MNYRTTIIPKPLSEENGNTFVNFQSKAVSICINTETNTDIHKKMKTAFAVSGISTITAQNGIPVFININAATQNTSDESYTLSVKEEGITIQAASITGAFYGCISAGQLIAGAESENGKTVTLPLTTIKDKPFSTWRGFLLDTCRSFYSTAFIKKMLDACALHKLNILHWHLTDDQGWRFEVPGYPKLIEVGSKRLDHTLPVAEDGFYDEEKEIRRWYTDEEIKDIINYAAERCIQIVPEVEFPGHSSALLAAYPKYGCTGGPYQVENRWGIFPDVLCLGNDDIFTIYEAALKKLAELFPSNYIHIGGDECPQERWDTCPKCRARMEKEGLDSPAQLQAWGTTKIASMVAALGKTPIGWDEVLDNNKHNELPANVIVQSWRGTEGGIKAASMNHKVIMSPSERYYLNLKNKDSFEEPGRLGVTTAKKAYSFSPAGKELKLEKPEQKELILGGECALWTEKLPHSRNAEYLIFPRFCAIAEALWLPEEQKDFEDFKSRLVNHKKLLHKLDYRFYEGELE